MIEARLRTADNSTLGPAPCSVSRVKCDREVERSGRKRPSDAEANKVGPIVGGVPVAVDRAETVWKVAPGTAAQVQDIAED
jgi:hypothetical protein